MTSEKLRNRAVAFYQCRGDGCNNIEPGAVTTVTKVTNGTAVKAPTFALSSNLKSEQTVGKNSVSKSKAIITNFEDEFLRRGKQLSGLDGDDDDSAYQDVGQHRNRSTVTVATTTSATTTTKKTTPKQFTEIKLATVTERTVTRPRRRKFTIFDRR